jgi:CelD/BcsL family acetyltransferase involved in cellulose biosynthesis
VLRLEPTRGWFLKAVRLDSRDVTDTVLDFQAYQGKPVEVVLTQTASEISGRAVNGAGQPVANYVAVAFAEDSRQWTPLTRSIGSARPDQQGRFSIRGLPPGRYLVAAVDYLPAGQEKDPRVLERLRARATAVTLAESGAQNLTVTVIP